VGGQTEHMELDEPRLVKPSRRKRGLSVVDNLMPYNIADDLLNTRANTTYGQMLQYLNQRRNLAQVMRRPLVALEPKEIQYNNKKTNGEIKVKNRQTIVHGGNHGNWYRTRALGQLENVKSPRANSLRRTAAVSQAQRKFIPGFVTIAQPLHHLLQKDIKFEWGPQQQQVFETLKTHLITAPVLKYPDFDDTFFLYTDASGTGLGAILAQKDVDGKEHVISYASRSLSKAERNYSACELECLAVIWVLKGKRAHWILRLQSYNYTIQHRSGRTYWNVDALSRINRTEDDVMEAYMLGRKYRSNLEYLGPSKLYGNTYQTYSHPTHSEHLALEIVNRRKAIYTIEFHRFNLIATEPRQLLTLQDWIITDANQELARRKYLRDNGIDLEYTEPLNLQEIKKEKNANRKNDRKVVKLKPHWQMGA
ncbi:3657_t:CDS:2, partial [Cetraspora pellucida]